jgi:hypothetical protein
MTRDYAPLRIFPKDEERELDMRVGTLEGRVIISFAEPMATIWGDPDATRYLARLLILSARAIDGKPFVLDVMS